MIAAARNWLALSRVSTYKEASRRMYNKLDSSLEFSSVIYRFHYWPATPHQTDCRRARASPPCIDCSSSPARFVPSKAYYHLTNLQRELGERELFAKCFMNYCSSLISFESRTLCVSCDCLFIYIGILILPEASFV